MDVGSNKVDQFIIELQSNLFYWLRFFKQDILVYHNERQNKREPL